MTLATLVSGNVDMNEEKKSNVVNLALAKLRRRAPVLEEPKPTGVTVADILAVFPGASIVAKDGDKESLLDRANFLRCEPCSKPHIPLWRRGGKIVQRTWPDGRKEWACHFCGRVSLHNKISRIPQSQNRG